VAGYSNRGIAWLDKKEYDKAVLDFGRAIHFDPSYVVAYTKRGTARFNMQDYDRAVADYERAARLEPNYPYSYSSAAWLRATSSDARFRDGQQAVALATKACELSSWADAEALDALAAAYAEVGDFDLAVKYQSKAIELDQTDAELVNKSRQRLALYKDHKPYRQE
jgi:tetratricopeptide (TPR) repeat protein